MFLCCGPISTATDFLTLVKAKPHVVALAACLLLGGGLRRTGLMRGIGDFDPSGRSGQTHFYHFHPDEETLIRHVRSANYRATPGDCHCETGVSGCDIGVFLHRRRRHEALLSLGQRSDIEAIVVVERPRRMAGTVFE